MVVLDRQRFAANQAGPYSHPTRARFLRVVMLGAVMALGLQLSGQAFAQASETACGSLHNAYGPFDYRTDRSGLTIVEDHHFTPRVEALIGGQEGYIGGDLDYTLRAFPNHHRALLALMRFEEKEKSSQPVHLPRPVECYFERAIRFRRGDPITRMLYATYLGKHDRIADAKNQLAVAEKEAGDNAFTHYNIGMVYVDLKDYDRALVQAHQAYKLGFKQPGLRDRLKKAGKWREAG